MSVPDTEAQVLNDFIEARLARAQEHLDELGRDMETLFKDDRARISLDRSPDKTQVFVNLLYRRSPHPNRRWATIVGDFVHNLRSALNNSVYAVGMTNADPFPPEDAWLFGFPIADTKADWRKVKRAVRSIPEDARAVVKAAQPCHGGNPLLGMLGWFSNKDKHALPVPAAGSLSNPVITYHKPPEGSLLRLNFVSGPAIGETPLVTLEYSKPQTSKPDMEVKAAFGVFLPYQGDWVNAFEVLPELKAEVAKITDELKPFIV